MAFLKLSKILRIFKKRQKMQCNDIRDDGRVFLTETYAIY